MHTVEVRKHPTVAFLLSLFPGMGHLYLGKYIRTLLYGGAAAAPLALLALFTLSEGLEPEAVFVAAAAVFFVWCVNLIDMAFTLSVRNAHADGYALPSSPQRERTVAVALSLLPGVGHIYLGAGRKGLALLLSAIGAAVVPFAAAIALHEASLLLGWLAVPSIIAVAAADALDAARRIERGERLADGDWEAWIAPGADGRRPAVAFLLSIAPGVGHLYLGSMGTGIRLFSALLILLYLKSEAGIDIAGYALPLLWCWAIFDVLRRVAPGGWNMSGEPSSWLEPAISRWAGIGLIAFGVYVLFDRIAVPALHEWLPYDISRLFAYRSWIGPLFAAALFIGIGCELLRGRHR